MQKDLTFVDIWLYVILISLAISPVFALGEGNRNLLLIGVMGLSPLIILKYLEFDINDLLLVLFIFAITIFPMLNQPESMRWSTVMYSVMFCLNFMAFTRLLHQSNFTIKRYLSLLKWLIHAYTITLIIQQICVLMGLPIFNLGNYNPVEPWKLNSLTTEPSHSARIIGLLMYCYIVIKEFIEKRDYQFQYDFNKDKWIWFSFLWTMLTMNSSTAFLFIAIILSKFIKNKTLIPFFILTAGVFSISSLMEFKSAERTYRVTMTTLTLDEAKVMETDGSAGARIIPLLTLSKTVTILSKDGWFGHGVDQVSKKRLMDYRNSGYTEGLSGTLLTVWYEYGFISFFIFVWFSFRTCFDRHALLSFVFWFMLVFLYGVNNQIVWLCLTLLYINKFFSKSINKDYG